MQPTPDGKHWILWDGACGVCARTIRWVTRKDVEHQFHSMPYQETPSPPMTPELEKACERAAHVITRDGKLLRAGRASLFILERVSWGFWARALSWPPFVWFAEIGYWLVARNRRLVSRFLFSQE
jgi:predicted DCC family thiol-disulfide oxidoreductase YuxK